MARAAINLSSRALGNLAQVGSRTVTRFENGEGDARPAMVNAMRRVFERAGIIFDHSGAVIPPQPWRGWFTLALVEGATRFQDDFFEHVFSSNPIAERSLFCRSETPGGPTIMLTGPAITEQERFLLGASHQATWIAEPYPFVHEWVGLVGVADSHEVLGLASPGRLA